MHSIVIIEGLDGSGKTTVIERLRQKIGSGQPHPWLIDRGPHSNYVYESLNGRSRPELVKFFTDLSNCFDVLLIYLDVSPAVAYGRMQKKENENFKYSLPELQKIKRLLEDSFCTIPSCPIWIAADGSIDEVVGRVYDVLLKEKIIHD